MDAFLPQTDSDPYLTLPDIPVRQSANSTRCVISFSSISVSLEFLFMRTAPPDRSVANSAELSQNFGITTVKDPHDQPATRT